MLKLLMQHVFGWSFKFKDSDFIHEQIDATLTGLQDSPTSWLYATDWLEKILGKRETRWALYAKTKFVQRFVSSNDDLPDLSAEKIVWETTMIFDDWFAFAKTFAQAGGVGENEWKIFVYEQKGDKYLFHKGTFTG